MPRGLHLTPDFVNNGHPDPFEITMTLKNMYVYGDRGSIPGRGKDFSSNLCGQTGSGVHPASCTMGTGGPFPGGKARPGRDIDHSPPSSAEVENE
jgi:hypothetical protein